MSFVERLAAWREDPVLFVRELFLDPANPTQPANVDPWQEEVLRAFVREDRVALKACKGPGKTCVLAWAGLNFFFTRPHPKIICTSITGDNLKDGLWTEFAKWIRLIRPEFAPLRDLVKIGGESIVMKQEPNTWFISARSWPKDADKHAQADSLAGIHEEYSLFLLDEVSDYPDGVVVAAEASLSAGTENKIVVVGNPTRCDGPLWRIWTKEKHLWWTWEITGDPDDPMRAPRVNAEWARKMISSWGRENPYVLVNIFGKFPPVQSNKLIGPEEVSSAQARDVLPIHVRSCAKVMGIDVARMGDDRSVIARRQGPVLRPLRVYRGLRVTELRDQVVRCAREWEDEDGHPVDAMLVDDVGVGGGLTDELLAVGHRVVPVNNGSKAADEDRFENKWSEMWWHAAEWLKSGCLPSVRLDDQELGIELQAPTYTFATNGQRLKVEPNKDLKKRLGKSLDLASAFLNTFATPVIRRDWDDVGSINRHGSRANIRSEFNPFKKR